MKHDNTRRNVSRKRNSTIKRHPKITGILNTKKKGGQKKAVSFADNVAVGNAIKRKQTPYHYPSLSTKELLE